jgi:hypothetical protein
LELVVPASGGGLVDELRTFFIFVRDLLADLLARINPQRRVGFLAERKVKKAEKRTEFLMTTTPQEWDEIVELRHGFFHRLVASRVGEMHLADVVHDRAAVMFGKIDALIRVAWANGHHSTVILFISADGHAVDRLGQDPHEDQ